jgi:hypothetical protein
MLLVLSANVCSYISVLSSETELDIQQIVPFIGWCVRDWFQWTHWRKRAY